MKNVLVAAAPLAGGTLLHADVALAVAGGVRRLQPGRERRVPAQRRAGLRGRPRAPHQAVRGRSPPTWSPAAWPPSCRSCSCSAGSRWAGSPAAATSPSCSRSTRSCRWRTASGSSTSPSGHRRGRLGLPAPCDGRCRARRTCRRRSGSCSCTTFGSLFMVAGKRYAEMALARRDERGDPTGAHRLQHQLPALRVDPGGDGDGGGVLAVGLRDLRGRRRPSPPSRSPRSCWRCCATRSTSTAARPASPEDIVSGDRVLQVLGLLWLVSLCLAVYR